MSSETRHNAHKASLPGQSPDLDALYAIAEPKAGYFTASEAVSAGYSRSLLAHHVHSGMLDRIARGVYRLRRFPESPRADLIIAQLRAGTEGAISHESALEFYDLSDVLPSEVHVTVPRTATRRRRGVRLHTCPLRTVDVTTRDGVRVTTVERTIADVARSGLSDELALQAIEEALERGLTTPSRIGRFADLRGGRARRLVDRALDRSRS